MKYRAALILSLLVLPACSDAIEDAIGGRLDSDADEESASAAEAAELTTIEAALLMAAADSITFSDDADASANASAVAAAAATTFDPPECVRSESVGPNVTWTFDGCTGPRGLVNLSGVANLVISEVTLESVALNLTATALEVNDATMTINVTGDLSTEGELRRVDMTTAGVGTMAGGRVVGRAGTWHATFDDTCLTLNGQWTTTVNNETFWNTAVTSFRYCGACPENGTIIYTGVDSPDSAGDDDLNARAITVTFDGSDTARFVTTRLGTGRVELGCGE